MGRWGSVACGPQVLDALSEAGALLRGGAVIESQSSSPRQDSEPETILVETDRGIFALGPQDDGGGPSPMLGVLPIAVAISLGLWGVIFIAASVFNG